MTTFTSIVTTNPDFGGFEFYVEAGQQFDDSAYEEATVLAFLPPWSRK